MTMQTILLDDRLTTFSKDVGDAGYDLQAVAFIDAYGQRLLLDETTGISSITIHAGTSIKICTGIKIWIKDTKIFGAIFARSKLADKFKLTPSNCVAVIDSGYQGEYIVSLHNESDEAYAIRPMDKIAQLIFLPVISPVFSYVKEFPASIRGEKGILCEDVRK